MSEKKDRTLEYATRALIGGTVGGGAAAMLYSEMKDEREERRKKASRKDFSIPIRPDHGNQMLGDLGKENNPGYSLYGRMKGLAEIRGLELGIRRSLVD